MDALDDYGSTSSSSSSSSSSRSDEKGDGGKKKKKSPTQSASATSTPPLFVERGTVRWITPVVATDEQQQQQQQQLLSVRNQPHVNGIWAGHCYLCLRLSRRLYLSSAKQQLKDIVDRLERAGYSGTCQSHLPEKNVELHLSLSRTFYLQAANLEPFLHALTKHLAPIAPFSLDLDAPPLLLLHNDERTRSFLVWPVLQPSPLVQLVRRIDTCLALYKLPPYYDPPIFHVSLASFVPAISDEICQRVWHNNRTSCIKNINKHTSTDNPERQEESCSSSSCSENEEEDDNGCGPWMVSNVHVTFGTTKHYTISLCHPH